MTKLEVDRGDVEVPQGATLLQARDPAGREILRFCNERRGWALKAAE